MHLLINKIKQWNKQESGINLRGITGTCIDYYFPALDDETIRPKPKFAQKHTTPLSFLYRAISIITAPISLAAESAFAILAMVGFGLKIVLRDFLFADVNTFNVDANKFYSWFKLAIVSTIAACISPFIELYDNVLGGIASLKNEPEDDNIAVK
ncbi:MAG: hypothetical protein WC627_05745 [Legionella sp.]|jgi:hypothetical protein